ncbi:MAG TPA: Gfo/Idh/MocA family oxidoreductase [Planctomycetia bacterium]|nr:Gfo/Idh/MocA family oxidoreductase [Planctomycetia bacterium]
MKSPTLRIGMVGAGMIFDETYRPAFLDLARTPLFSRATGPVEVKLAGIASRTGGRAAKYRAELAASLGDFATPSGPDALAALLASGVDAVCIATPDDRHFDAAKAALAAGKHVLIEKPSVLRLAERRELEALAAAQGVLAKVVYHKLLDPDHKRLRTLVADGVLRHVNHGYCSLLEPKSIATGQFAEWIAGRNPSTYVACHYIKLIDFTFGGRLRRIYANGQRGIVGPAAGDTWDSVQLRLVYEYDSGREAAFDIHTSWVTPDNFPGYVEQEVQFRFDNGVWNGHSRKRGVELTVEGETPLGRKITINNHYNGSFLEPWGERAQRGYGVEVIERFFAEVAAVEFGGPLGERPARLAAARGLAYDDLTADLHTVAAVQATEAILAGRVAGHDCSAELDAAGRLLLWRTGDSEPRVLDP